MSNTYEINQHSVVCSLNERSIYLKITDKIAFLCYEGNFDLKDFRLTIDLNGIYQVLCNCFSREEGYEFNLTTNAGTMKLGFTALVGGFLRITSEILLREKIMSNDGQLTLSFNRLEQQYLGAMERMNERIQHLEQMVERLSNADVYMYRDNYLRSNTHGLTPYGTRPYYKLNTDRLVLNGNSWDYTRIKEFFNLKYLEIIGSSDVTISAIENRTVEYLKLQSCDSALRTLEGINKLPNVTKLELISCSTLSNVVAVLSSYKHKIKEIVIQGCPSVNQVEMNTYCTQQKIKLTYT
jgi:hypothetical protein